MGITITSLMTVGVLSLLIVNQMLWFWDFIENRSKAGKYEERENTSVDTWNRAEKECDPANSECLNNLTNAHQIIEKLKEEKEALQDELIRFKWPVTIANEIDTFMEVHDWKVNLTAGEEKMIKKISDQQRRQLNTEIDSYENKQLSRVVDPLKRRNVFCSALIWAKVRRNKIHDLIHDGTKVSKCNIFMRESWNEALTIFVNVLTAQHRLTESEDELDIITFESAGNNMRVQQAYLHLVNETVCTADLSL